MTPAQQVEKFKVAESTSRKTDAKDGTFEGRLLAETRKYYSLTKASRHRRYYLHTMADLFAKGLHWFQYNNQAATFTEWAQKDIDDCLYTPVPRLQYAVEVIAAQYTNSNARPVAMSPATDIKTKAVVRQLQDYAEYLDWEFYRANPDERQTEAKLIPLRGVFNLLEYDYTQGQEYDLPQYEGQESLTCQECGESAAGDAAEAQCPGCGSANVKPMMTGVVNQGSVKAKQGKVVKHLFDAFQVELYDRRRDIEDSPYLIADEICFKSELLKAYPWLKEISGQACLGNWNEGFIGLHYLHQLETIIANTGRLDQSKPDYITGYGGAFLNELLAWRRRVYFDKSVYADWVLEKDTQLPGTNQIVPKGTQVAAMFPDGMCIHIINNSEVVKLENLNKNQVWSMVKYRVPSTGMHGTGVSSLVAQNRQLDEATSFQMQGLLMAALGITVVDERLKETANQPGRHYWLPLDARMPNEPISNFAARFDMGGSAAIASAEPIKQSIAANMSDLSMASAPAASNLIPSADRTATATRVQAGAVNTLTAPPLELYGAHRAKVIGQAIELERKYALQPKFYGKFPETTARWFDPMRIPENVRFIAAEDSWQPRTMETKREDIAGAIGLGIGSGKIANPAIEEQAMRVFGLNDEVSDYDDWAVKAEKRLDAMKEAVQSVMGEAAGLAQQAAMEDPEGAAEIAPMLEQAAPMKLIQTAQAMPRVMDKHPHFIRFYEEYCVTDEFDNSPQVLQQAIETLWNLHQQAMAMQAQQQTALAVAAQAPMQAAQAQQGQDEHERAEGAEKERREEEAASNESSRQHEERSKESDHERQLELQDKRHEQAKEIESIRARSRNKPIPKKRGGK